jgi:hypothetical protein
VVSGTSPEVKAATWLGTPAFPLIPEATPPHLPQRSRDLLRVLDHDRGFMGDLTSVPAGELHFTSGDVHVPREDAQVLDEDAQIIALDAEIIAEDASWMGVPMHEMA